jgi:hypothetical protein
MGFAFLILRIWPTLRMHCDQVFTFGVGLGHSSAHFSKNGVLCRATALQELATLIRSPPSMGPRAPIALPPWMANFLVDRFAYFFGKPEALSPPGSGHPVCRILVEIWQSFSSQGCFCSGARLVWNSLNSKLLVQDSAGRH